MKGKTNPSFLLTSIGITLLTHALVVGFVILADRTEILDCDDFEVFDRDGEPVMSRCEELDPFRDSVTLEAALAFKEVKPRNKQPVKLKKKKFAANDQGVSRDPDAKPIDKKDIPKHKVDVEPDEVDTDSILEKNRTQDPDLSSSGVDEKPKEGSATGSQWGTEREAKGHPYAGELRGRIHSVWEVPSLETEGGTTLGCVRLNSDGKIIDSKLKKRSKNSNLNRSVTLALKKAPKMDEPVPDTLLELLTVKGICFRFELEEQ